MRRVAERTRRGGGRRWGGELGGGTRRYVQLPGAEPKSEPEPVAGALRLKAEGN
jgi:hypothetical protein